MNTQDTNRFPRLTEREIVLETLEFYGMGGEFSVNGQSCCYSAEDGRACAVGRCLAVAPDVESNLCSVDMLRLDYDEDFLPPYRGHSEDFWCALQAVHDTAAMRHKKSVYGITGNSSPQSNLSAIQRIDSNFDLELPFRDSKFKLAYPAFFYQVL